MEEKKLKLLILAFPGMILLLYLFNINDFFLSDDFIFLFHANFFTIWTNPMFNVHPLATIIFGAEFSIFKFDPTGYHLINIILHVFNSFMVYLVISKLTNEKSGLIGGLIFAVFPLFSEPVIWISAQSYLWMTAFVLLFFFSYLKYNKQKKVAWLTFSLGHFGLALLCEEIALVFIITLMFYDVIFDKELLEKVKNQGEWAEKVKKMVKYYIKYLPFIAIIIIYYIFFMPDVRIYLNSNAPYLKFAAFINFIPNSFFPLFLDNSELFIYLFTLAFFGLVFSLYFVFKSKNKALIFSWSWILILITGFVVFNLSSLEIYFYSMILHASPVPQGRFLYIIAIGVVLFYSTILNGLHEKKFNFRFKIPNSRNLIFISLVLFLLVGSSLLVYSQQDNWKRSSRITTNILLKTFTTVPIGTPNVKLYYINVPSYVSDPFGPNWPTAYIFENGLQDIVRIFYPNGIILNLRMVWHEKILDFEMPDGSIPIGLNDFNQISNDSSNVILFFNPVTELLINVSGLNYSNFDPYPHLGIPKAEYWFR